METSYGKGDTRRPTKRIKQARWYSIFKKKPKPKPVDPKPLLG